MSVVERLFVPVILFLFLGGCSHATVSPVAAQLPHVSADLAKRIEDTLSSMTLAQKVGQKLMVDFQGAELTPSLREFVNTGHFGGVLLFQHNIKSKKQIKTLVQQLQLQAQRKGAPQVPLFVALDQEGGSVDRLKNLWRTKYTRLTTRKVGDVYADDPQEGLRILKQRSLTIAQWLKELGINMNLAPVLDMSGDPTSFIYKRSFGFRPQAVAKLGQIYIQELQDLGVIATAKHFPNLGDSPVDSHTALPVSDKTWETLWNNDWLPFREASLDVGAIMIGHIMLPKIDQKHPASLSKTIVNILRKNMGYTGIILCDDIQMKAISMRYTLEETLLQATLAGIDVIMMSWDTEKKLKAADYLIRAVKDGTVPEALINDSVRRILATKYKYL